ncbi:thioredoxin-dependent thiol peroxidase [Taibaiella sp. KBW10]|uniref:thioredoxin-dependent thiol peroxidase n=1 Tax=Taibaiella sp. KBW10 TaxID=2153357 RepID=UPI000F594054|nr:thioredoxin-dependent thiol peroxidase [Taibaiella sp. KBW10]RQO31767.1 thioredoxin-dependent thiol peroxidase [Taibaiella sp. KBW10]
MLALGNQAPDFKAIDQNGISHQLKDYKGKKLALYFYPKDNTPGCTVQACNVRDHYALLETHGISILGVSIDTAKSHQKFTEKFQLNFPILVDEDHSMVSAYQVWQLKKFMGKEFMGTVRTTFLINEQGMIEHIINKVKTKDHVQQILALWT